MNKKKKGFTLLEILLAVAALVILAGIVILALNPGKQLADTRNAQRQMDVNTILDAVYQYAIDNEGDLPAGLNNTNQEICLTTVAAGTDCDIDLNQYLASTTQVYLVEIPTDPKATDAGDSEYTIATTTGDRIIVSAPLAEEGKTISVTR